jgi:uncharacterized lipoprotein YajG
MERSRGGPHPAVRQVFHTGGAMNRRPLILVAMLMLLAGCAHTVKVPLHPMLDTAAPQANALSSVRPALVVAQGRFTDSRTDTTMLAMFQQGPHTFNLYGDRPMSQVLNEGLQALFTRAGHKWVTGGDAQVRVDAQLLSMSAARNAGFVAVGASSAVQVKLDFFDVRQGKQVYTQVYNGSDKRSQAMIGLMSMVNSSINQSIVNCLEEVGRDEQLAAALRAMNPLP